MPPERKVVDGLAVVQTRMAKAKLRGEPEPSEWKERIGRAVDRARTLAQLTLKEFADVLKRDERQVARWISGAERAQFDVLLSVPRLRGPVVIALAEIDPEHIDVRTEIRVRQSA